MAIPVLTQADVAIRPATVADRDGLLVFLAGLASASRYTVGTVLNRAHLTATVDKMLALDIVGSIVAVADARIVGILVLLLFDDLISGDCGAAEVCWYVEPPRRSGLGPRLLRAGEQWAAQHGATKIQMLSPEVRFEALYARRGYIPTSRVWERRLEPCRG